MGFERSRGLYERLRGDLLRAAGHHRRAGKRLPQHGRSLTVCQLQMDALRKAYEKAKKGAAHA